MTDDKKTSEKIVDWQKEFESFKSILGAVFSNANPSSLRLTPQLRFTLTESFQRILDLPVGGGPILPVPEHIANLVRASNQIVRFVLDDKTHFGSGILVGPCHVLTAAHLFFEEDGCLIDRHRLTRITVEIQTTYLGRTVLEGETKKARLYPQTPDCFIDPYVKNDIAQREVFFGDFAIVRIDENFGDDWIGETERRKWFRIPTAEDAGILFRNRGVRTLQFLDRGPLLTSSGVVRGIRENGWRVLHTAGTADSASGCALVSEKYELLAMHVGGSQSGERPKLNRAIPIRRVAEIIDQCSSGTPVRELLRCCERPCP